MTCAKNVGSLVPLLSKQCQQFPGNSVEKQSKHGHVQCAYTAIYTNQNLFRGIAFYVDLLLRFVSSIPDI